MSPYVCRTICWLALILSSTLPLRAEAVVAQPAGAHAVGVRVVQQSGPSGPRQSLIWYPAATPGATLRYRDYLATRLTALRFDLSPDERKAMAAQQEERLVRRLGGEAARRLLNAPMRASREAKPATGRFPVVVYAPGVGGPADENADLCEYLASHGYVVLASVGAGADGQEVAETLAGVEPQVADINFLIRHAQSLSNADTERLAVMGWSWGGMSILFAAAQDSRIGAVISLDGTREPALTRLIDVKRLNAPWLYVSRTPDTIPQINRSGIDTTFSLLNEAKHAPVMQLIMYPMLHGDFVSRRLREDSPTTYDEYSREEVRQAFGMVALYVRHFLDAHLKEAAASQAFLARKPVRNGAVPHSIRIERSTPVASPE